MKKFTLIIFASIGSLSIYAQSLYTITNPIVERKTVIKAGSYEALNAGLVNNSTAAITISFKLISNNSPEDWVVSLCGPTNCFTPNTSRSGTGEIIKVSAKTQVFEVKWSAFSEGKGEIVYEITDLANPTDKRLVTFKLEATLPTGTESNLIGNFTNVYPNPTKGFINIELPDNSYNEINIMDIAGRTVYSQKTNELKTKLDLNNLEKGTYILTSKGNAFLRKSIVIE